MHEAHVNESRASRVLGLFVGMLAVLSLADASAASSRVDQQVRAALQLDQNPERGAKLYAEHCARCHGPQALGDPSEPIPSLAGQRRAYLIKQLADFTELQRDSRDMHRVVSRQEIADPQAWADIAGYLNRLPTTRFPETGDGTGVELGEAIFQEQCASCHGEDARGDDDGFVPSLRDQHYSYLALQIRSISSWHRLNVDADFVRFLDSLDSEELTAVADYLSRLRGPVRDRAQLNPDGTVND
ncbi:MAG TPA: c-type cytochrome [Steroidobacteraceae bacterium]|jgi:cytochrome c553